MLMFSLFAMLCIFPPALGRVLCLAAPRESGLHVWLITGTMTIVDEETLDGPGYVVVGP